jgi:hypothetical protein
MVFSPLIGSGTNRKGDAARISPPQFLQAEALLPEKHALRCCEATITADHNGHLKTPIDRHRPITRAHLHNSRAGLEVRLQNRAGRSSRRRAPLLACPAVPIGYARHGQAEVSDAAIGRQLTCNEIDIRRLRFRQLAGSRAFIEGADARTGARRK